MVDRYGAQAAQLSPTIRFPAVPPQNPAADNYFEFNWTIEEWSRGDFAAVPGPGVLTGVGFGPAIRAPFDRVHWAGVDTVDRTELQLVQLRRPVRQARRRRGAGGGLRRAPRPHPWPAGCSRGLESRSRGAPRHSDRLLMRLVNDMNPHGAAARGARGPRGTPSWVAGRGASVITGGGLSRRPLWGMGGRARPARLPATARSRLSDVPEGPRPAPRRQRVPRDS